ncbi:phosphotransferase family protein [Streptomyces sp. NPDC002690]
MPQNTSEQRTSPTGEPVDPDAGDRATAALTAAGLTAPDVLRREPLTGGTYNTVTGITLTDGRAWVLKTPPAPLSGLAYERDLLVNEVAFYRATTDPRVPGVVRAELDPTAPGGPYLIMTSCPGRPWTTVSDALGADERLRLRAELGGVVAGLHAVTGTDGYGYPAAPLGPLAATWREAFSAMAGAVLADADAFGARLPVPTARVREVLAGAAYVLDDVTRPALVHFDLWDGNLLVDGEPGNLRLSGVIDGERMFWGDPVADFVSLALLGDLSADPAFLAGYAAGGGDAEFTPSVRLRLALYSTYLYLIMLTEAVPRGYGAEQQEWLQAEIAPRLVAALAEVEEATRTRA